MHRLPQKSSLVAQTAALIREQILTGNWREVLPCENELCSQYHIARMTLRRALQRLEREGLLRSGQGKRRQIIASPQPAIAATNPRVLMLTRVPVQFQPAFDAFWINELRLALEHAGYYLEIRTDRACFTARPGRALEAFTEQLRPAGWVLANSTREMQDWFSRRRLPCVIVGSRHEGLELPYIDKAYRAVCRHAIGLLLARGHTRLALLNPDSGAAGDLESEQGFYEAVGQSHRANLQAHVIRHNGTVPDICSRLNQVFRRRSPPTALLVSRSMNVITAMAWLMNRGLRLPGDVALISRDDDSFLQRMVPSVARYVVSPETMGKRICGAVLAMLSNGGPTPEAQIMPEFKDGESLGPRVATGSKTGL